MAITINKFSSIPLYLQLKESIKNSIKNNEYKPGDKVPTEEEICNNYQISRTVVKQAMTELVNEGYLVRYKSKGTYVNKNQVTGFFKEIVSFNEEMRRSGYIPRTKVLNIELISCPEHIAEKMKISSKNFLVHIERLRYRNDEEVYYVDAYYISEFFPELENMELEDASLYDVLEEKYNIIVCRTLKSFYPKLCTKKLAQILGIKAGSPIQYVESIEYDQYDRLVSYDESFYIGDRNTFMVEIKRNSK
ncbi:MAG: GntR family transcriptional regulator [Erysipelotrichaceae bacterium]|nr:GntR family transcriptional regulator [Erysipelotrichaceae bacterium]